MGCKDYKESPGLKGSKVLMVPRAIRDHKEIMAHKDSRV
jgi:hypothetical protein